VIGFDLEKYLNHSRKVDLSEFDFSSATQYPLTASEIRCLEYMMDIELSTIGYLRSVLRTSLIYDPEAIGFLSCWAYEEYFHGRVIREYLKAAGVDVSKDRTAHVRRNTTLRERAEEAGMIVMCALTDHFTATFLTWGAIQEMTTLEAYHLLASRTGNPVLKQVLWRLAKDERRHFSFYFNKARVRLEAVPAQRLTTLLLKHFWTPVGSGVKKDPEVEWMIDYLFAGSEGADAVSRIDSTIARLPGLAWFNLFAARKRAIHLEVPAAASSSCTRDSVAASSSHSPALELSETSS